MNRKLLCYGPFCYPKRIKHDRETLIAHSSKHYCRKCWKFLQDQRHDRTTLYHFIENKAKVAFPTGMMRRDIKKYHRQFNYTYRGIYNALVYADKFAANFRFNTPYFLHYVPFIYDKAQRWRYRSDQHNNLMLNASHIDNQKEFAKVDRKAFVKPKKLPLYDMNKF